MTAEESAGRGASRRGDWSDEESVEDREALRLRVREIADKFTVQEAFEVITLVDTPDVFQ